MIYFFRKTEDGKNVFTLCANVNGLDVESVIEIRERLVNQAIPMVVEQIKDAEFENIEEATFFGNYAAYYGINFTTKLKYNTVDRRLGIHGDF